MAYGLLRRAILERRSVTAKTNNYVRYFSPHILGVDIDGARIVIGYQYGGGKLGGLTSGGEWCRFDISELQFADLNNDPWRDGPPDSKPRATLKKVDVSADSCTAIVSATHA